MKTEIKVIYTQKTNEFTEICWTERVLVGDIEPFAVAKSSHHSNKFHSENDLINMPQEVVKAYNAAQGV